VTRDEIRAAGEALAATWPEPTPELLDRLAPLLRPVRNAA
jgi:hypothetical protein